MPGDPILPKDALDLYGLVEKFGFAVSRGPRIMTFEQKIGPLLHEIRAKTAILRPVQVEFPNQPGYPYLIPLQVVPESCGIHLGGRDTNMPDFLTIAATIGLAMLIWDCFEVGRNDAANLVNAVFGARVLQRRLAVSIAAMAVILGAGCSSQVMETARKGIFDPNVLTVKVAMTIYLSVYIVDTVLLYGFSSFGMPVSTTACLVFELVGASWFLAGTDNVVWDNVGKVTLGIVVSIAVSGLASFVAMRVFRAFIKDRSQDKETVLRHGPWIAGLMNTWLAWFMIMKGLKNVSWVKTLKENTVELYGDAATLLIFWGIASLLIWSLLRVESHVYRFLFPALAILGMICMAFAFGQNDLANAASPGLASYRLWQDSPSATDLAALATKVPIPVSALIGCGVLMAAGMFSTYAQRVTRAAVNTGSQHDNVTLYSPRWCIAIANLILKITPRRESLAPESGKAESGKKIHYDSLRAAVITAISGSVIAFASGRGLPVSTTYVAFAAVLGSGFADRVFSRGDAEIKLGRAIWVITCWFVAPVIAIVATGTVALTINALSTGGIALCIVLNIIVRYGFRVFSDTHEEVHHAKKD